MTGRLRLALVAVTNRLRRPRDERSGAQGTTYLADTDPEAALGSLQAAACTYRIALGPRAGQKVLSLQTVGTTHIVMSPLEFMQRLAALVPRPRLHLMENIHPWIGRQRPCCSDACGVRFHGGARTYAKLRPQIIPSAPVNANDKLADHGDARPPSAPARLRWAQLLKRVFDIDIERCSHCGGPLTIIAAIIEPQ